MNYFQEALASSRSTVLYGSYGRYPRLVQFYLEALPELTHTSDSELVFRHSGSGRLLHVLFEPPFLATVPPSEWCLVLTSHLRLHWNPLTTRVMDANLPLARTLPMPLAAPSRDHQRLIPPTSHLFAFFHPRMAYRVDLSHVSSPHEAYLRLLTFLDVLREPCCWSLSIPERLRQRLVHAMPSTGPYDTVLLRFLS